jgi:hypothetical protein
MTEEIIGLSMVIDDIYTPTEEVDELEINSLWYYNTAEEDLNNRIWRMSTPTMSIDNMNPRQLFWYHMCLTNGRILKMHFREEWIKLFEEKLEQL